MNPRGRKQSLRCLLLGRKDSLPCSPSLEAQISLPKTPPGGHGLGQGSSGVPHAASRPGVTLEQKKGFLSKSYQEDESWEIFLQKNKQLFGVFRCHPEKDPQHLLQPGEAFGASESRSDHLQRGVSSPPSPKRCWKV